MTKRHSKIPSMQRVIKVFWTIFRRNVTMDVSTVSAYLVTLGIRRVKKNGFLSAGQVTTENILFIIM